MSFPNAAHEEDYHSNFFAVIWSFMKQMFHKQTKLKSQVREAY